MSRPVPANDHRRPAVVRAVSGGKLHVEAPDGHALCGRRMPPRHFRYEGGVESCDDCSYIVAARKALVAS